MISLRKIHFLITTARLPNVPSVISNVWLGIALAAFQTGWNNQPDTWFAAAILALAGIFLYVSGNFLNDWYDRDWDLTNRPERALPQRIFTSKYYLSVAISCAGIGVALATFVNQWSGVTAGLIVVFILIYTRWHKKAVWPVIPMGICRALLPIMGWAAFTSISPSRMAAEPVIFILTHALGLLVYIAGLSLSARYESMSEPPPGALFFSRSLLISTGILMSIWWIPHFTGNALLGLAPFVIWLVLCVSVFRRPIPKFVSGLLAGIPLVDWIAMFPLAISLAASGLNLWTHAFASTVLLIPPVAFILGRLLQRLSAAT